MATLTVTVLGCGGSGGVPGLGSGWGRCDPREPRNRRRRPAIVVNHAGSTILVDTPPELREQLLDAGIENIDAVIYTHGHADHLHGIDDLRPFNIKRQAPLPVYTNRKTLNDIRQRFGYTLEPIPAGQPYFHPVLEPTEVKAGETHDIAGLPVQFIHQDHGFMATLGLRIGPLAYSTDVVGLDTDALASLAGITTWIVDCQRPGPPHSTHANLDQAVSWIQQIKPNRAYFTHMNHEADYETLVNQSPPGVAPAYDGLVLEVLAPELD